MQQHAQHLLGVEIVFMLEQTDELLQSMQQYSLPLVQQRKFTSSASSQHFAAMLLPKNAEFFVVYTDANSEVFVRAEGYAGCFFVQLQWAQLKELLPPETVCRALLYRNKQEQLILGVFDVLRLAGVDHTQMPVVERHKVVHQLYGRLGKMLNGIVPHWVGEEGCLLEHMRDAAFCDGLPFEIDHMLRIDESGTEEVYKLVLRPLQLPKA